MVDRPANLDGAAIWPSRAPYRPTRRAVAPVAPEVRTEDVSPAPVTGIQAPIESPAAVPTPPADAPPRRGPGRPPGPRPPGGGGLR